MFTLLIPDGEIHSVFFPSHVWSGGLPPKVPQGAAGGLRTLLRGSQWGKKGWSQIWVPKLSHPNFMHRPGDLNQQPPIISSHSLTSGPPLPEIMTEGDRS